MSSSRSGIVTVTTDATFSIRAIRKSPGSVSQSKELIKEDISGRWGEFLRSCTDVRSFLKQPDRFFFFLTSEARSLLQRVRFYFCLAQEEENAPDEGQGLARGIIPGLIPVKETILAFLTEDFSAWQLFSLLGSISGSFPNTAAFNRSVFRAFPFR